MKRTRLAANLKLAGNLKLGDKFCPAPTHSAWRGKDTLTSPLLVLGIPVKDYIRVWVRTDTPCPEELKGILVYHVLERKV